MFHFGNVNALHPSSPINLLIHFLCKCVILHVLFFCHVKRLTTIEKKICSCFADVVWRLDEKNSQIIVTFLV